MKTIPLTRGKVAIVSDCDFSFLNQWKWCCSQGKYAVRERRKRDPLKPTSIRMHVVIAQRMGFPAICEVDHRDNNGLNNQRRNLRPATKRTNGQNRGPNKNNTSGYKGVSRADSKWVAEIKVGPKRLRLGRFATPQDAAIAYDKAARTHFGSFAFLNFPTARSSK